MFHTLGIMFSFCFSHFCIPCYYEQLMNFFKISWGEFRTLSNIYGGVFCKKYQLILQKASLKIFDRDLNTPLRFPRMQNFFWSAYSQHKKIHFQFLEQIWTNTHFPAFFSNLLKKSLTESFSFWCRDFHLYSMHTLLHSVHILLTDESPVFYALLAIEIRNKF